MGSSRGRCVRGASGDTGRNRSRFAIGCTVRAGSTRSLEAFSASLAVVLGRLERGEGTLGRLSTDPALYESLEGASAALEELLVDLRSNPKRYVSLSLF